MITVFAVFPLVSLSNATVYAVTVDAVDQYSSWVDTSVYIDGNYAGQAGDVFYLSEGIHTIAVDDLVYNAAYDMEWCFSYFDAGSGGNPTTVNVNSGMGITAYYILPW